MPKWNLSEHRIYYLLRSSSNNERLDEDALSLAYKEFVKEVVLFLGKESDYKVLIRELTIVRDGKQISITVYLSEDDIKGE